MKKFALFLSIVFSPMSVFAGGPYDGIWQTSESNFTTVNQNGNTILVVGLDLEDGEFDISSGELAGDEVIITSLFGNAQVTARIVFQSLTSAAVTLLSCTPNPGYICTISAGVTIIATKVF